jgi:NAD(P)-dependent dehydrogenase (short-subunit alcohol dehydrogenase family)
MGLENQVALVTGATSEIGYAYVKCLLQNKVKVGKQKLTTTFI